jgi:ribosome-associated protein YbcJ (S4-like RNA binding protein)
MNEGDGEILDYFSELHQLFREYSLIHSGGVIRTDTDTP